LGKTLCIALNFVAAFRVGQAQSRFVTSLFLIMPVPLPLAPACPTALPAQPQNPATLVDIANAIEYNRMIRISRCMLFHKSLTCFKLLIFYSLHVTAAGGATKNDVGRGAVYEAAVVEDNAGIGMYFYSNVHGFDAPAKPSHLPGSSQP
jgi:hypothetical protein